MYGLKDKIEVRRGSGLTVLKPGEADGAVIAGMGGSTIVQILEESPEVAKTLKFLIVQPMAGAPGLRRWACENGWRIADEALAEEPQHLYEIIMLVPGSEPPHSSIEYEIGPRLIEKRPPLLAGILKNFTLLTQECLKAWRRAAKRSRAANIKKCRSFLPDWRNISMSATVNDIVKIMDSIAPRNLAEEWDNAGFLIGRGSSSVKK